MKTENRINSLIEKSIEEGFDINPQEPLPPLLGAELRKTARKDIQGTQLNVSFGSDRALAKAYVDNISLGGLFLKTTDRPALKSLVNLNLAVQSLHQEAFEIQLQCQVVRHATDGIGLTFTNLDSGKRAQFESFIKNLPALLDVPLNRARLKDQSIERLDELRNSKVRTLQRNKTFAVRAFAALLLVTLNIWALWEVHEDFNNSQSLTSSHQMTIGNQVIDARQIQRVTRTNEGLYEVIADGVKGPLLLLPDQVNQLPPHLKTGIKATDFPKKVIRKSKTAPSHMIRIGHAARKR